MMKKMWIAAAVALCAYAGVAQAADSALYVGGGLGLIEMNPGSNKSTAFGGYVSGGAELHPNLALEARLGSSGSTDNADFGAAIERSKVDWFVSFLAKPKVEVTEGVTFYGLLGLTSLKASFTGVRGVKANIKQSKTSTNFSFGVGGEYAMSPRWTIGSEWVRYSSKADTATKDTSFQGLDVNGFTASVRYAF